MLPTMELDLIADRRRFMHSRTLGTYQTGIFGEDIVASQLADEGWKALGRRVRTKWGEVDLIMRRGDMIAFVEVKVASPGRKDIWHVIDDRAQHRIRRAAVAWMAMQPRQQRGVMHYRFDVAVVHLKTDGSVLRIDMLANAF